MSKEYDPKEIESKWQAEWKKSGIYHAKNDSDKPKYYTLIEFPYPSGDGLHVGHPRPYIGLDVVSRKRRMQGYNVLYPIGWDAFGLPTENYAIKTGKDPRIVTKENSDTFRRQIQSLGISFDWSREIDTTDPAYYKWTQWIFLKFLEKGLAYKAKSTINWCPKCKIGLANEEVVDGKCERCGTPVEKREKEQWMLAITKYADRLDKGLDDVDYPERVKIQQRNWIGRSEGAEIEFMVRDSEDKIRIFTTRPDTIFGATYMVLAPEHELVSKWKEKISNWNEVSAYVEGARAKTDMDRSALNKDKTGVRLEGMMAINPASKEEIPVWIADYVLPQYGTGAIMAVPADDERDREFAEKFNIEIRNNYKKAGFEDFGQKVITYKLRDWVFSRQRYWGEPIPVVHCGKCGIVPVPEKDLPVLLPVVENYQPTDSGESPLANVADWVNTTCPKCGGEAKRETDVMPNWAGSSWYYLRYTDPHNDKEFASKKNLEEWIPVDWYNGGMEHTTLHLLYSRFWHKFLFDLGLVPTSEPYKKRTSHGLILAEGGVKMSKSLGNVINPDEIVTRFGADTLRLYEMFMGPFEQAIAWSEDSLVGPRRFLERVWRISEKLRDGEKSQATHRAIKKVSDDIESLGFNTAVSALMILVNELESQEEVAKEDFESLLLLLAPFAPHISEELWQKMGHTKFIHTSAWPEYDEAQLVEKDVTIVVQVNGRKRGEFEASIDMGEEEALQIALDLPEIKKWIEGKEVKRCIYVPSKLVNIVVSS